MTVTVRRVGAAVYLDIAGDVADRWITELAVSVACNGVAALQLPLLGAATQALQLCEVERIAQGMVPDRAPYVEQQQRALEQLRMLAVPLSVPLNPSDAIGIADPLRDAACAAYRHCAGRAL